MAWLTLAVSLGAVASGEGVQCERMPWHGMLLVMTGGIHQPQNQHSVRSGTQGFLYVKHEFALAMATLFNVCIAWQIVAE